MKKVVISGAGSGIGRAIAIASATKGYGCILIGRNTAALQETLNLLPGEGHTSFSADITDKSALANVANSLSGENIFAIVANAGIGGENYQGENDRWDEIISTNLSGTYHLVNAFLGLLQGSAKVPAQIVIMSSVLARLGVSGYTAYCASKAGLLGLMRSWAVELAPRHILVNAICPGWVETDMSKQGMEGIAQRIGISVSEFYDQAMQSVPLRRMSQPAEIADLAVYLLNQRSITGQVMDINGGSVMNS